MDCTFSTPVDLGAGDFEYSELDCDIFELITNEEFPARKFYIQKTLTYGEAILIFFCTIFAVFLIGRTIFNFLWKK